MIRTYAELQTSVGTWLARTDLAAHIPEFVQLAEAEIGRRLRKRSVRATLTVSAETTTLPADCAELRTLRLVSGSPSRDLPIDVVTKVRLDEVRAAYAGVAGRPQAATVVGGTLLVAPTPNTAYDVDALYYEKLIPLETATGGTNGVLDEAPDLYLWGALKHAAPWLQHDERVPLWEARFEAALTQLDAARQREESTESLQPARLPMVF